MCTNRLDCPAYALTMNHLPALAFVPVEGVNNYYDRLMSTPFFTTNRKRYSEFLRYFEQSTHSGAVQSVNVSTSPCWAHLTLPCGSLSRLLR